MVIIKPFFTVGSGVSRRHASHLIVLPSLPFPSNPCTLPLPATMTPDSLLAIFWSHFLLPYPTFLLYQTEVLLYCSLIFPTQPFLRYQRYLLVNFYSIYFPRYQGTGLPISTVGCPFSVQHPACITPFPHFLSSFFRSHPGRFTRACWMFLCHSLHYIGNLHI